MKYTILVLCSLFTSIAGAADPRGYQGKFAQQIYSLVEPIAGKECDVESCSVVIDQIACSWDNGETPKAFECSFTKGSSAVASSLKGKDAKKFVSMMQKYGKVDSDTVSARAKFSQSQKVSCREIKGDGKKPNYNCTMSTAGRTPSNAPATTETAIEAKPETLPIPE